MCRSSSTLFIHRNYMHTKKWMVPNTDMGQCARARALAKETVYVRRAMTCSIENTTPHANKRW